MADKIVAEYTVKVDKALKDLNKLAARVDKVDDERKKVQNGFKDMSKGMVADFKKVGAAIGLAFGVDQLVSFGKEAVKVAAQAEGIRTAFARLNQPNLLNELRKATRGAVDDITLMRQAIRAQNFKVPLEKLGTFFEFATKRSIQTGESVDYLVNSIIDGIGRKSTLVLDNLGISATELQEEMKRTGDFGAAAGAIIARELEKAGDVADTTAIRISQIQTALENIKLAIGQELIGEIDRLSNDFSGLAEQIERLFDTDSAEVWSKALQFGLRSLTTGFRVAGGVIERVLLIVNGVKDGVEELYNMARKDLAEAGFIEEIEEKSEKTGRSVKGLAEALAEVYKKIKEQNEPIQEVIKNLAYYNQLIKDLQTKQAHANTTREKVRQLEDEINEAIRQRLILLGKLREVGSGDEERFDLVRGTAARMTDAEFDAAKKSLVIQEDLTDDILEDADRRNAGLIAKGQDLVSAQRALQEHITKDQEEQEQIREMLSFAAVDGLISIVGSVAQIQNNLIQDELNDLQAALENGSITREEFEDRRKQLLREQAENQKSAALFQATIDGAAAVVATFRTDPTGILAAIVGATVAANIAAIASQPLPEFAEGGFVNEHGEIRGRSHKQGGVKIEAEGGEFITSAKHAKQNADILKAINSGQWEKYKMENIIAPAINQVLEGGFENMGASYSLQNNFNDKNLLRAIDRHRTSDKDGFIFLAQELKRLKPRKRGGFA